MLSVDGEPADGGEDGAVLPTTVEELRSYRAMLAEDIRRGRNEAQRMASRLDQAERVLAHIDATISTRSSADGSAAPSPVLAQAPIQPEQPPAPSSLDAFLEAIPIAASLPLRRRNEAAPAASVAPAAGSEAATAAEPPKDP